MDTVSSAANPAVKAARKLRRRSQRDRAGEFLVEGPRVLEEARGFLVRVFVGQSADEQARSAAAAAVESGAERVECTDEIIALLAETEAPRGVVGVARLARLDLDVALEGTRLALLCCDVADPGNAGAIIRSADAAGADLVAFSRGSVDAGNPKAVRASAGSVFHLPVIGGVDPLEAISTAAARGLRAVGADAAASQTHTGEDLAKPTLLVFGGEAHGLPHEVREACDDVVRVSMHQGSRSGYRGQAESLNLAVTAALLVFEAQRQRVAGKSGSRRG